MKTTRKSVKRTVKKSKNGTRVQNRGLLTQDRRHNRLSMFLAALVVVILMIAVSVPYSSRRRSRRSSSAPLISKSTADIPQQMLI